MRLTDKKTSKQQQFNKETAAHVQYDKWKHSTKYWVKHVKIYSKVYKVRGKITLRFGTETWTQTKDKKTGCSINTVPCTTFGCYRDKLHVEVIK